MSAPLAVITGAARGQGLSHARRLAADGFAVLACDVLDEEGEAAARGLRADGLDVSYRRLDVASESAWAALAAELSEVAVLVNNAGIIRVSPLCEEPLAAWNRVLEVNLTGTFLGTRALAPLMGEGGRIINISSVFATTGSPGYAAYAASKAGILGLTRVAALELAPRGIRVNAVLPGGVATPMNANEPGGGVVPRTPLGRRADVGEVSGLISYLAGPDSAFVTGAHLVIDGGFEAG